MRPRSSALGTWSRRAALVLGVGLVLGASVLEVLDLAPALQLRSRALTVAASFIGVLPAVVAVACVLLLVGLRGW
ncbi:MAG TPA: hypothetical protein VFN73_11140, partial [Propionibacteriaceae bacterium]|nr:hypothetical protein [Propionibacteriaceae bacterium]